MDVRTQNRQWWGVIKEETDAAAGRQRRAGGEDLTDEFVRESSQEV